MAAMDISRNDPPPTYAIKGLPTIYLAAPGQKGQPVPMKLSGAMDEMVDLMLNFVADHSSVNFGSLLADGSDAVVDKDL